MTNNSKKEIAEILKQIDVLINRATILRDYEMNEWNAISLEERKQSRKVALPEAVYIEKGISYLKSSAYFLNYSTQ